jgi:hypothetical protein
MALGKVIGEFSLKATSFTVTPGSGGAMTIQGNFEGPTSGDQGAGTGMGTLTAEGGPGAKSGTWRYCGMTFLNSGGSTGVTGQGTWEESGPNKWRYRGTGENSDGSVTAVEYEGDLATRTIAGKVYEWK